MRRRLALLPIVLLLPLAACGGRSNGTLGEAPTAETTTAPTVTAAPTSTPVTRPPKEPAPTGTTVSTVSTASTAKPSGSRDTRWGTQYAILKSSRLATRQITYDLIEWYDGREAVRACAEDGVKPAENDYCVGWYIRNNNKKLRTLTVDPDAAIRMTVAGEMKPVSLETFLSEVDNGNVIRFDIDASRIIKLEHVFLP
jgi:hypothetical protein